MKIWSVRIMVILAVLLTVGVSGYAQSDDDPPAAVAMGYGQSAGDPGPGSWHGPMTFRSPAHWRAMADFLNLSKDQVDRMQKIWARYYLETRDMRYDMLQKKLEMHKLFTDPRVSAPTLMAKEKELGALQQKLFERRAQMLIDERAVMTPEQVQKLDFMPMGFHRMGPGMMGGRMGR